MLYNLSFCLISLSFTFYFQVKICNAITKSRLMLHDIHLFILTKERSITTFQNVCIGCYRFIHLDINAANREYIIGIQECDVLTFNNFQSGISCPRESLVLLIDDFNIGKMFILTQYITRMVWRTIIDDSLQNVTFGIL